MTKEEHEQELMKLYRIALKQENVEICLDILGQQWHFGYEIYKPTQEYHDKGGERSIPKVE